MRIHAHIMAWNEEKMLPFTLDYYSQLCEKIFVYDNMSSDNSDSIYRKYKKVIVNKWNSDDSFNELYNVQIKSNAYRKSREDNVDWVIVCDTDEFLYHSDLMNKLKELKERGVDMPLIEGHDMVSDTFPTYDGRLITEIIREGSDVYEPMNKNILFNPQKDVQYSLGAHMSFCRNCVKTQTPELKLLHYKFLGFDYVFNRYRTLNKRLSEWNRKNNASTHYTDNNAINYMDHLTKNKIQVI